MTFLRHPIHWLRAYKAGVRISSSAVIRGIANIRFGKGCRIGRQAELNASQGNIELGEQSSLGLFSLVESRGDLVRIGARTAIGPFCILYGHGGLEIGNDCMIASHVVFIPENHRFDRLDVPMREQGGTRKGICVEDDVWLATQVVVLDGVRIGKGAVVGAGAVVTRDIPPYAIAHGVPARVISYRSRDNQ
jgi:carbonic anhydrase/acetyltransferase-like protein (isoleucine patch superfamily)